MAAMLIHVIDREITTEKFDTLEKAREEMQRQYDLYIDNADEGEIEENSAWMNSCDDEVHDDWMIVEL